MIEVHLLTSNDAPAFQALRLQAVEQDSQAFLSVPEVEQSKPIQRFINELNFASLTPPFGYFGAFDHDQLVAFVQLGNSGLAKQQHVAYFYNLYVEPSHRGQGIAQQLCQNVADHAAEAGIERIFAVCLAANQAAFTLYQKLGFTVCGRRERSVKWQNTYDDEIELVKVL